MIVKFILVCCVRMTLSKGHSPRALKWCFGKTTLVLVLAALALPACAKFSQDPETLADLSSGSGSGGSGGGSGDSGGDGDADDDGENYVDEYGADYALGTPSIRAAVSDKLFLGSKRNQPYVAPGGTSYDSLFAAHTALNTTSNLPIASRDTNVTAQWDAGWTGKGVKIGIIDDFSDNNTIDSHGDKVSLVVNSVAPEADMLCNDRFSGCYMLQPRSSCDWLTTAIASLLFWTPPRRRCSSASSSSRLCRTRCT